MTFQGRVFIDTFSSLDELKGKDRANPHKVLKVLKQTGRFSCFEVDPKIGACLNLLKEQGKIEYEPEPPKGRSQYPWTHVKIIEKTTRESDAQDWEDVQTVREAAQADRPTAAASPVLLLRVQAPRMA
jgi:hypothetical protein